MSVIKPFKGYRPPVDIVEKLASRPYDVLNSEEARVECEGNPYSLLHVTKAEIDTFTKILFGICYRFRFKGSKKLPNTPCIIVANHRCAIDGFLITYNFSRKINKETFFFAKEKHWRTKFAQFFARKNNIILMDINKNVRQSIQEMCAVLKKGKNIVIFPEGTRSRDNKMKKFKETFAILSKELNVPIIPVAIAGSESACYGGSIIPKFWKKIDIEVLEPVMPSADQSVESLRDKVAALIEKHLSK